MEQARSLAVIASSPIRRSARATQSCRTYRGEVTGSADVNSRLLAQALWLG